MTKKKRRTKQLRDLIRAWAPLLSAETKPDQELHHRVHLSALITTMLSGRYPL
jgi:hypothetical protein